MKFKTIIATVANTRINDNGSKTAYLIKVFSADGKTMYKDCWLPVTWFSGKTYAWAVEQDGHWSSDNHTSYQKMVKAREQAAAAKLNFRSRIFDNGKLTTISVSEELTTELVEYWNPDKQQKEEFITRYKFNVPEWMHKNLVVDKQLSLISNFEKDELLDDDTYMPNDGSQFTIIEDQSWESTQFSDDRARDMGALQTTMFSPVIEYSDDMLIWDEVPV